ncbi:MAG: hypothetical protein QOF48_1100, partial [Verrucomicrobiota bacterium]
LFRAAVPDHFIGSGRFNLRIPFRVVLIVQTGFRPAHAAHDQIWLRI